MNPPNKYKRIAFETSKENKEAVLHYIADRGISIRAAFEELIERNMKAKNLTKRGIKR